MKDYYLFNYIFSPNIFKMVKIGSLFFGAFWGVVLFFGFLSY